MFYLAWGCVLVDLEMDSGTSRTVDSVSDLTWPSIDSVELRLRGLWTLVSVSDLTWLSMDSVEL